MRSFSFKNNSFDIISLTVSVWVMLAHIFNHSGALGHVPEFITNSLLNPGQAVTIMFFVSGFLCYPSLKRSDNIKTFYTKRFWRIAPAYVFVVLGFLTLWLLTGHIYKQDINNIIIRTIKTLLSLDAGWPPNGALNNGALWTIPIQIQFYILTPFIAAIIASTNPKQDLLIYSASIVLGLVYIIFEKHYSNIIIEKICIPYLYTYIMGMMCYKYFEGLATYSTRYLVVLFALYMLVVWVFGVRIYAITDTLLLFITLGVAYKFSKRLSCDISYGIYLWHMPVFSVFTYT